MLYQVLQDLFRAAAIINFPRATFTPFNPQWSPYFKVTMENGEWKEYLSVLLQTIRIATKCR